MRYNNKRNTSYYYKKGFVKELKKLDENIYSSVVSGTYNYNVILNLNDLKKCSCSCPHKVKICKHVMATYYTVFPEEAKQYEEGLKLVIKGYNEHRQRKDEQYNEVYKKTVEYVDSLTVDELKKELINFIVDRDYYDEYDPYDEDAATETHTSRRAAPINQKTESTDSTPKRKYNVVNRK